MPSDKARIYLALYARGAPPKMPGEEDRYHWALIVGPKIEDEKSGGMRYHAKESAVSVDGKVKSVWGFAEQSCSMMPTAMILVRVLIGKVNDEARLVAILRGTPIRDELSGWNCVFWVKEALSRVAQDKKALGTSNVEWQQVRDAAMTYVAAKVQQHRFDGQVRFDTSRVATYSLLEDKETIP